MTPAETRAIAQQLLAEPDAVELALRVYQLVAEERGARICAYRKCRAPFYAPESRSDRMYCDQVCRDNERFARAHDRRLARKAAAREAA